MKRGVGIKLITCVAISGLAIQAYGLDEKKTVATPKSPAPKVAEKNAEAPKVVEKSKSVPAPASTQAKPIDSDSKEGIEAAGLDTENKASGNWVLKKQYFEEAQDTFSKIRNINDSLLKKQMDYIDKSADVEKKVDAAFVTTGFDQGELSKLLDILHDQLEHERKEAGELSEPEREFARTLKEKQEKIKQIKLDLKAVGELDDTVQSSVKKVSQQIKVARDYENKAWENFKKIGQILDHVEAHKLFYEVHGHYTSVQKIAEYINQGLWKSVVANADKVGSQLDKISSSIEALKAKGLDLKEEMVKFQQQDEKAEEERKKEEEDARIAKEKKALEAKKKKAPKGIVANVMHVINSVIQSIIGFFTGIFKSIIGFVKGLFGKK
ncbi:MAG TPA: hypothetical protein QGF02_02950 [Candidatus Babeliales bacterium]|nr:hypothetical protein [Candidatus Babeliales bacterium]